MSTPRDYGAELDALQAQMNGFQELIQQLITTKPTSQDTSITNEKRSAFVPSYITEHDLGSVFYAGQYRGDQTRFKWEPQERPVDQLLHADVEKVAKVLAALGHKQRLDILKSVLKKPLTGAELVERLNMGTTGQLYHHIKALLGADLLVQEERGGTYKVAPHRALPLLLLLAASSDLLDTTDYMELADTRTNAEAYLGTSVHEYDPHHLLWSVLENTILEHRAGHCSEVSIFLQSDGSITVADNGRGIPVHAFANTGKSQVQVVLTDMSPLNTSASITAPGSEKGITMPVVNALSQKLYVEVRREGKVFRQDYKHGIPQTELLTVGLTRETGTSITFVPDQEIFGALFEASTIAERISEITTAYPQLTIYFDRMSV